MDSPSFVEVAVSLIETGDHARAIDVCVQGLAQDPRSVPGRVLWGRALLQLGRPAEAMEQFDRAISVDRDDPRAYTLVAEVLLHNRLYRSALPILRKLVALQPFDERARAWLDGAQAALKGGPAPQMAPSVPVVAAAPAAPSPEAAADDGPADAQSWFQQLPTIVGTIVEDPPSGSDDEALRPFNPPSPDEMQVETEVVSGLPVVPPAPSRVAARRAAAPPLPPKRPQSPGLLGDIPEVEDPNQARPVVSAHAAEAAAREYEKELRQKHAAAVEKQRRSFLARNASKIAIAFVALVVVGAASAFYVRTLRVNRGSLQDALAEAKRALLLDTRDGYSSALEALDRALRMDDSSAEAWALTAYARAVRAAEHNGGEADRAAAQAAVAKPGVREEFRAIAMAVSWYVAPEEGRAERATEIIGSDSKDAELNELAGRILLGRGDSAAALRRFQDALAHQSTNVRALVALGDHYRAAGDWAKALEFYTTAGELSPRHVARALGAAECGLQLGADLAPILADVEALAEDVLSDELKARRALLRGRLLAATGNAAKAAEVLAEGLQRFPSEAFGFQMALGHAYKKGGKTAQAEKAFDEALRLKPEDEDAREALVRALVARDQPKEALARVGPDPKSRKVSLARGVAFSRLADWKKARAEFDRTQVKGKFPSEAVVHLALADAANGDTGRARDVLEKTLRATRGPKGEIQLALARLHQGKGDEAAARRWFKEASSDPDDVEGNCATGRHHLEVGAPETALPFLERAASRNDSHVEAHEALARAHAELGRIPEALAAVDAAEAASGKSLALGVARATALYLSARLDEADQALGQAMKGTKGDPESWRLRSAIEFARGQGDAAMSALEKANALDPKDARTFCAIAQAFLRQGNPGHAEKAYEAALREEPKASCARAGLVWSRLPSGGKGASRELEAVLDSGPPLQDRAFALAARSRLLLAGGKAKDARAVADEAVRLAPWSSPAYLALGFVAVKQKDEAAARDAFTRAVSLDPLDGSARLALADLLARGSEEDRPKALDEYNTFLQIGGDEGDVQRVERAVRTLEKHVAQR